MEDFESSSCVHRFWWTIRDDQRNQARNRSAITFALTFEPCARTRLGGSGFNRDNVRNIGRFCGVNGGIGLIFRSLNPGGPVRILRFLSSGSSRGLDEILGVLLMFRLDIVDGADSLHGGRPRGWSIADAIERLAGVNAEVGESYRAYQKAIVIVLFIVLREQRQHPVATPPGNERPWPSHGVTMQSYRRV